MKPSGLSSEMPIYFPSSQSSAITSEMAFNTPSEETVSNASIDPSILVSNATGSLFYVIPSEFRNYGPTLGPSRLVFNVLSVVFIGHDLGSSIKRNIPNTLPSVMTSEFPIFHFSAIPSASPSYIPSIFF